MAPREKSECFPHNSVNKFHPGIRDYVLAATTKGFSLFHTLISRVTQLTTDHLPMLSVLCVSPTEIVAAVSVITKPNFTNYNVLQTAFLAVRVLY